MCTTGSGKLVAAWIWRDARSDLLSSWRQSNHLSESNNHATPTQTPSSDSPHLPPSSLGHATSPTDNLSSPALDSLDAVGSTSSHTSDTSPLPPPPFPTLSAHSSSSIRFATSTGLRDNDLEGHDGLSSLKVYATPPPHHRRKGSAATVPSASGSALTEREYEDDQSLRPFRPSPVTVRFAPDTTSTLPSTTHTHVDVVPGVPSRPSSPARFL